MFIQLKNASKVYGQGESAVKALDGAELSAEQGEVIVVLGPSGSGKSTMLNIIGGLDTLDSGSLTVGGRTVSGLKQKELTEYRREDVGFIFQFYNLIPDLTARENVEVAFPESCPAASSSGWPSPAPWSRIPSSSCATS